MKKCPYCGKEYPDDISVCATDLNVLEPAGAPSIKSPLTADEHRTIIDKEHLKLLAIFHFVIAALALCGLVFLMLHYLMMHQLFSNPEIWKNSSNSGPPPQEVFKVFIWFYLFMGAILIVAGICNLLSGIFLLQRKRRIFSLVIAALNCLQIPFGTILGVFTIVVLSRDSVRNLYSD